MLQIPRLQSRLRQTGHPAHPNQTYTPQTNGKAERFIQTALREWAYARAYQTSDDRTADLPVRAHLYSWHRPHSALKRKPPISRLGLKRNNLLKLHI